MTTKIIADACGNHLGDIRLIEQMIKTAANVGVDFIKFQAFKADNLNMDEPFWAEKYNYYKSIELKDEHYPFIIKMCEKYNILPMFTVFHKEMIDILEKNNVKHFKIASPNADNQFLIFELSDKDKNVYISTGMIDEWLIEQYLHGSTHKMFYCVSKYPTKYNEIDFYKMQRFHGFSDHTIGIEASKKAIDLDMQYIERHFTLGKYLPGNDHFFSSTPDEFKELVEYRDYKEKIKLYKCRWK